MPAVVWLTGPTSSRRPTESLRSLDVSLTHARTHACMHARTHMKQEIWGIAHRILLPAFSNQGMKQYFHVVQECLSTLFDKVGVCVRVCVRVHA